MLKASSPSRPLGCSWGPGWGALGTGWVPSEEEKENPWSCLYQIGLLRAPRPQTFLSSELGEVFMLHPSVYGILLWQPELTKQTMGDWESLGTVVCYSTGDSYGLDMVYMGPLPGRVLWKGVVKTLWVHASGNWLGYWTFDFSRISIVCRTVS